MHMSFYGNAIFAIYCAELRTKPKHLIHHRLRLTMPQIIIAYCL